jgi:hypothetical protein
MNSPSFRIVIRQQNEIDERQVQRSSLHRKEANQNGFLQDENDFKNIEATVVLKVEDVSDNDEEVTIYCRAKHSDNTNELKCQGSAYKFSLKYDGGNDTKFSKEYYHKGGDGYTFLHPSPKFNICSIIGRWICIKALCYNRTVNGNTEVVNRLYVDDNVNSNGNVRSICKS